MTTNPPPEVVAEFKPGATRALKKRLARYLDAEAFEPVPDSVKFTAKCAGKSMHDRRKIRREWALKRAECAIRFFMKTDNADAIADAIAQRRAAIALALPTQEDVK